ncbi:MAG TPA: TrkH family potassium uptake protein, partial [Nitrospinaceae bacterium]|nr:TrkH family potassium uptake protein [Nitrospinaceae bacterium]
MNIRAILNVVGVLLLLVSGLTLVPIGVSLYFGHAPIEGFMSETDAFVWTFGLSLTSGLIFWKLFPSGLNKLRDREGFAIVTVSWLSISAFGALPLYLSGTCPEFIDAFFES